MTMSYLDRNNEVCYHHIRSVIILVAFTVLMAALTCLFAYLFDQISGITKVQPSSLIAQIRSILYD